MKNSACLVLFFAVIAMAKPATFGGFDSLAVFGQGTMVMTQGDIDGDGLADWVGDNKFSGRISIVRSKKFGNAAQMRLETSVYMVKSLALGDVDGDGKLDILACGEPDFHTDREDSVTMSVIFAGSDIGFQDSIDMLKGDPITCGRFLDVDLDGDLDIVAANWSLKWFENRNNGKSWTAHIIEADLDSGYYSGDGGDVWLRTGDFDRDSATDFIVGYRRGAGRLLFYRNGANGTFTKNVIQHNYSSQCAAVGDLDLDGMPDLLVGTDIFRNNRGTFTKDSLADAPGHLIDAEAIGDVNNDGYPDIVAGVFDDGVFLWQSTGKGAFTRSLFPTSAGAKLVAIADVNGDRFIDILALYESWGVLAYAENLATHAFAAETTLVTVKNLNCFEHADLNQDGITDIVTTPFKVFQGQVRTISATQKDTLLVLVDSTSGGAASYGFADFDKDGIVDIAAMGTGSLSWAKQADISHFTFNQLYGVNKGPMGIGDLDGNGAVDFLGRYYNSAPTPTKSYLIGLFNDGTGTFTADTLFSICRNAGPYPLVVADFDKDGDNDILTVSNEQNLQSRFYALYGKNKGNREFDSTRCDLGNSSDLTWITPFDMDKDGFPDLLWAGGSFGISRNKTNGFEKGVVISPGGAENSEITAGDIDRDGKIDAVLYNGTTQDLYWMSQDTSLGFISRHAISSGKVTGNIRVIDYDRDGWLDILCMQGDKLVKYRNLLGIAPAGIHNLPTRIRCPVESASGRVTVAQPRKTGPGLFQWKFPKTLSAPEMEFYLLNGKKIGVSLIVSAGVCVADVKTLGGLVVWAARDKRGKVLGRGILKAGQ